MAHVAAHLGLVELQAGYLTSGEATLARHYQVIWLMAQSRSCAETAALTGFALAVQWHPEWQFAGNSFSRALFAAFGEATRQRAARK